MLHWSRLLPVLVVLSVVSDTLAAAGQPTGRATDPQPAATVLSQYCFQCHDAQTQTAGINLEGLILQRPLVRNRQTWTRVIDAVEIGKMPPSNSRQLTDLERETLVELLTNAVDNFDYSVINNPGFEPIRRLTHRELDNTLRDLIGADFSVTERFPDELTGASGFDNSANTLFLDSGLMERYIAAAERVVELMLPDRSPKSNAERRAYRLVFGALEPGPNLSEEEAANQVLRRFLERAYRHPPSSTDLEQAVGRYSTARQSGHDFFAAIKVVLQAVLISPKFLMRTETPPDTTDTQPYRISDWDLASRLSYFIWASMPDAELRNLARQKTLSAPNVLANQIDRMLSDPRANTLGTSFAAQWLGFQHVGTRIWLDPIDNPWCTTTLMTAMRDESSMFFMSLIRDNQPIRRLIDADYTFVNEELAETLYGMKNIRGQEMRRVHLNDPNRGGVLGHGSTLAVTSNYKETSPVKRGHYVLDVLLGTPPPPPPPNAGVLSQEVADLRELSFRQKLDMHSKNESCRVCHSKIDPIGFSLENFDYFGRWRDSYHYRQRVKTEEEANEIRVVEDTNVFTEKRFYKNTFTPINASGALPSGTTFLGPTGLKQALLEERHSDLVRQTASKLLSYGLGRQLEYFDEPAVRTIIAALEDEGFRFRTLVKAIALSFPFQYKKLPSDN